LEELPMIAVTAPRKARAFTVLEVLVVVAVLGLLATLVMAGLSSARTAAAVLQCRVKLSALGAATAQYHDLHGMTPPLFNYSPVEAPGLPRLAPLLGGDSVAGNPNLVYPTPQPNGMLQSYPNPAYVAMNDYFRCPISSNHRNSPRQRLVEVAPGSFELQPGPGLTNYVMNLGYHGMEPPGATGMFAEKGVRFRVVTAGLCLNCRWSRTRSNEILRTVA
jgi:prepilin-type N-terminal cleavage/methylation domain-containing protein